MAERIADASWAPSRPCLRPRGRMERLCSAGRRDVRGHAFYNPAVLRCIGEARPGRRCGSRRARRGGPDHDRLELPEGPTPWSRSKRRVGRAIWFIFEPTPPGRHVGLRGEDVVAGPSCLHARRVLRPQDLGVLSALRGIDRRIRRPRVAVIVTGDELLAPGPAPRMPARRYELMMLAPLIARDGA